MGLTRFSITRPLALLMLIIGLVVLGVISYQRLRVDRLPNISFPFVSVSVGWPGASPADVEQFILRPLEAAVSGAPGVTTMTSSATSGRGQVSVQLAEGIDASQAAIDIERRVAAIRGRLPSDAQPPVVNRLDPNATPIMNIALAGNLPQDQLLDIANNVVAPRLQSVVGVADVQVFGGQQREVQIQVDLTRLAAFGITLQQIQAALARENINAPAGSLEENNRNVNIRAVGQYQRIEDLRALIISSGAGNAPLGQASSGGGVTLDKVATVTEAFKTQTRIQRLNGQPAVGLSVVKQSDANSLQVADNVKAQLNRVQPLLPPGAQVVVTNDSSRFTRASLHAVEFDLGLAVILCATVLLLFLHSWRNVLIVCLSIPTSLISTFIVMYALGISLNTVTLMALALSIGILVDDSIVVIENINRHLGLGEPPLMAALNGRSEIGLAAIAITLVDIVVYLPIVFMAGNLGQLFREYGIVIAVATLFSLFISFTLTPMLASRLLNTKRPGQPIGLGERFGHWFDRQWDRVGAGYAWTLKGALRARPLVILLALIAFGASLMLIPLGYVGTEYVPTDDDNQFTVSVRMPTGTALAATDRVLSQVEELLQTVPEVDQTFANLQGGNTGSIAVQLKDKGQRSRTVFEIIRDLRQQAQPITQQTRANIVFNVANPLGPTGGGGSGVSIQLLGDDYATLTQLVPQVEQAIRGVRGVVDVRSTEVTGDPEIRANANRQRMADLGISQQTIANTMRIAIAGTVVGTLTPEGELQRDITLIARPEDRAEVARLNELPIPVANGGFTRLANVTELQRASGPASINRSNRQRVLSLSANIQGRPLGEVAAEVRQVVAALPVPPGYSINVGGGAASLDNALQQFGGALILSVFLVYMLMVALYESFFHPLAIMFSLPVAVVGALVALWATGNTLNIFSLLGMIMLMGLVAKNGILLVDYINTVRSRGAPRLQAILEASPTRLKPIMMTSATLVFAMIPLALKLEAGAESRAPLAVVVIGGVLSSTFLTLYVVPAVYTYLDSLGAFLARLLGQADRGSLPTTTPALATASVSGSATVAVAEPPTAPSAEARPRRWFGRGRTRDAG